MSASLSVSIVTFAPEMQVLRETLRTLAGSLAFARQAGTLGSARVTLVDNGPGAEHVGPLTNIARGLLEPPTETAVLSGHGNVGYGRANNLALLASDEEFHLAMNPDVSVARDAIHQALAFMAANPGVVILGPDAQGPRGELLYPCKRYPSVLGLALRGFAPDFVKSLFRPQLERYEMRDLPRDRPFTGVPLLSGSFMFCRRALIARIGGFSNDFFLYFEDFDLSLRAASQGELAFVPAVRITHHGGQAAKKGLSHVRMFVASAIRFFNRHGWKWA
jgi:hypothetical protein